ncbi:MAG: hypothetical protein K2Y37_10415 [Pirellulales bacterium]|nr:hypothetical protein [Pirellulales bacterium]
MGRLLARSFAGVVVAPLVLAVAYHEFLGQRSDYLGHYLAGCGGTLLLIACFLAVLPDVFYTRFAPLAIVVLAVVAIAIGGVFESTIYRIAKFDEVDFCNQSLGAVLAALGLLLAAGRTKPPLALSCGHWCVALALLAAGYHYAFL